MIIAESKGKISHSYMQFITGHKGDIEARYSTNKDAIAHYDRWYAKSLQRMQAIPKHGNTHLEQSSIIKEAKIEVLKSMAKSLLGIDLLDVKVARENSLKEN